VLGIHPKRSRRHDTPDEILHVTSGGDDRAGALVAGRQRLINPATYPIDPRRGHRRGHLRATSRSGALQGRQVRRPEEDPESEGLIGAACTWTTTSSAAGSGTGTCCSHSRSVPPELITGP